MGIFIPSDQFLFIPSIATVPRLSSITSLTSIDDNSGTNNINIPINENINLMQINTNNNTISMNKKQKYCPSR